MKLLAVVLLGALAAAAQTVTDVPVAFEADFRSKARPVRIVGEKEAEALKAPSALVRLANRKLALKVRDKSGRLQPFYVRGLGGIGYWNKERPTAADYEKIFSDYEKLASNTALVGIHWRDLEPEDGRFDFAYTDMVVSVAKKHNIQVWWVLFTHFQPNRWPEPDLDKFWVYHLDDRSGANYAVQWLKDSQGTVYDSIEKMLGMKPAAEVFLSYSHPKVYPRLLRMLRSLGSHYRNSGNVIGLQLGNEEGFGPYSGAGRDPAKMTETDFNPFTQQLFEDWKLKTGKSDWYAFKMEAVKFWWSRFASAFHETEPYKLVSFNLLSGASESHDPWMMRAEGADSTLYGEGNIDVIGSMLYRTQTVLMWPHLDQHYDYVYRLPVLIPSEIGLRPQDTQFLKNMINTIERGGQGYAIWNYQRNMVAADGSLSESGQRVRKLAAMIQANEDVIHPGLPGAGDISLKGSGDASVSQLHAAAGTLGIVWFPGVFLQEKPDANSEKVDVSVEVRALKAGRYAIQVFRDGAPQTPTTVTLRSNETHALSIPALSRTEAVFVKVR
jgi:hypothetical protein